MSEKKWRTEISDARNNKSILRWYEITDLMGNLSFSQAIFLELSGRLPSEKEARLMDAMLVAPIDNGIAVPSITAARISYSGAGNVGSAIAAGVLAIGEHHGGAIEQAAKIFQDSVQGKVPAKYLVDQFTTHKKRFPGYGHKIFTTDPRTQRLMEVVKEEGLKSEHLDYALELEREIEKSQGKKLCLNVDGAIAACISDLGFDWRLAKGFFIIPRVVGILAHVHEESLKEKPFRRLEEHEYDYYGPQGKKLPGEFEKKAAKR